MSFGERGMEQKHWSTDNFEIAIKKLQDNMPVFGEGGDTREEDGKYFVMGLEVLEPEYNVFLDKFEEVSGEVIHRKNEEYKNAA